MNKTSQPYIPQPCRYCGLEVLEADLAITFGYWYGGVEYICHKGCKDEGYKRECYECQVIDADCNDCKHFERGQYISKPCKQFKGNCKKLNKPTTAFALTCTAHECFEHRRSK